MTRALSASKQARASAWAAAAARSMLLPSAAFLTRARQDKLLPPQVENRGTRLRDTTRHYKQSRDPGDS